MENGKFNGSFSGQMSGVRDDFEDGGGVVMREIDVGCLSANPFQCRKVIAGIEELAEEIKERGINMHQSCTITFAYLCTYFAPFEI